MEYYERIKELRIKKNLTQQRLAELAGYNDRSSIAKIESGYVDIPQSKLEIFAKILDCTPAYLMGWEDLPQSQSASSDESSSELDMFEERLVSLYRELNEEGRRALLSQADIMTNMDTYNKDNKPEFYHCEDVCTDRLTDKREDKMAG